MATDGKKLKCVPFPAYVCVRVLRVVSPHRLIMLPEDLSSQSGVSPPLPQYTALKLALVGPPSDHCWNLLVSPPFQKWMSKQSVLRKNMNRRLQLVTFCWLTLFRKAARCPPQSPCHFPLLLSYRKSEWCRRQTPDSPSANAVSQLEKTITEHNGISIANWTSLFFH